MPPPIALSPKHPLTESTIGLELTFIPYRPGSPWQEWLNEKDACNAALQFNILLAKDFRIEAYAVEQEIKPCEAFVAKGDTFRAGQALDPNQPHRAYCVEVNGLVRCNSVLSNGIYTRGALQAIYDTAALLKLRPHIERRQRDGTLLQFPTGGGHLHVGLDFWDEGASYLPSLYYLERALCLEYANNPWIRWLFSQWFDDTNSSVAINLVKARILSRAQLSKGKEGISADVDLYVYDCALRCHSIKQRIAWTGKPQQPTYEFRFFDMPRSVDELKLQITFLSHWLGYCKNLVDTYAEKTPEANKPSLTRDKRGRENPAHVVAYQLTPARYQRLSRDLPYARRVIKAFFAKIGLDSAPYLKAFFERNYATRLRYGRMV